MQRFNKKDSATSEEPDERDLRDLMKFVEDDTLKGLCKHLFAASGAMFSVATHMTLETLFSHPAEYAKRHRESPEVQGFKQNPSRESMVAYIASQTLSHTEAVAQDEPAGSIWDTLTQRSSSREARQTSTFWDVIDDNREEEDPDYEYDDEPEEDVRPPTRRRQRTMILDDDDEEDEEDEPFNTPKSSAEHALFITQADPDDYHEPGTLSRADKGKARRAGRDPLLPVTFGPGSASVPTRAPLLEPQRQRQRENRPHLGREERDHPEEQREAGHEAHEPKGDTQPLATSILISVARVPSVQQASDLPNISYCRKR